MLPGSPALPSAHVQCSSGNDVAREAFHDGSDWDVPDVPAELDADKLWRRRFCSPVAIACCAGAGSRCLGWASVAGLRRETDTSLGETSLRLINKGHMYAPHLSPGLKVGSSQRPGSLMTTHVNAKTVPSAPVILSDVLTWSSKLAVSSFWPSSQEHGSKPASSSGGVVKLRDNARRSMGATNQPGQLAHHAKPKDGYHHYR